MSKKNVPMFIWNKAYNPEFRKFKLTGKCPKCGHFHLIPRFIESDGTILTPFISRVDRNTFFECKKCQYRFPLCIQGDETKKLDIAHLKNGEPHPVTSSSVHIQWAPQEKRVQVASEVINVPLGVTITLKRSRTIEHSIDIAWRTSSGGSIDAGLKQIIGATVHREIEEKQGRTYLEREKIEYDIELCGDKCNRYKITWVDVWLSGNAEIQDDSRIKIYPFEFRERSEIEVVPSDQ